MADDLRGVVLRTNGSGFLLKPEQGEQAWRNFSKYAAPEDTAMPEVGMVVLLTLDQKGYIRKVQPTGERVQLEQPRRGGGGRDQKTITRLAAINSAIAVLTSGGRQTDTTAVLREAAILEAWALR